MIHIMLVDDHLVVRDGLKTLLFDESNISITAEANNGSEALNLLAKHTIDVVLMDINMPHMDGLDATAVIKDKYPNIRVIALTMYREMDMVEAMFRNGAKAYLLKSCSKAELLAAIQGVAAGEEYIEETLRQDFEQHIKQPVSSNGDQIQVSKREKEVLQLISEEHTTAEIAEKLFISVSTVESHRKNMLKKLGLRNTAGLMRYAFQHRLVH